MQLLPQELITIGPGEQFASRDVVLEGSSRFAAGGGKLTRLEFPRTEIQAYGATAIIYTTYSLDILEAGTARTENGKATEIFVRRGNRWLNTGWQLAPERKIPAGRP